MRKIITYILLSMMVVGKTAAIGEWNAYLAYHDITDIEPAGRLIYVLSSKDLFSYNIGDKSVYAYNKANTLSDTEISHIAWNPTTRKLLIVYSNFNIDLLDNNFNVENISDYYSKAMTDDKTVNNITMSGNYAYIATGFGIVKLNMRHVEISETYNLGKKVTDCAVNGTSIYAKTANGNYKGNTSLNLVDPNNWTLTTESVNYADANDITVSNSQGYTEYIVYDATNKCYWSNQQDGTLQGWTSDANGNRTIQIAGINADGPRYNYFGFMKYTQGGLYTCDSYSWDKGKKACIQVLRDNNWTIFQDSGISEQTGVKFTDMLCLDVDRNNPNHVFVGAKGGVYEYRDAKFVQLFNKKNSPIEPFNGTDNNYQLVTGVVLGKNGTLWCVNSQAPNRSLLSFDGSQWTIHDKPELMKLSMFEENHSLGHLRDMFADSRGKIWFCNNHWIVPSFYAYDIATDQLTCYTDLVNQNGDQVATGSIRCLTEDKLHNIWVGTNVGPVYLSSTNIQENSKILTQHIVARNDGTNLGDYLLSNIDINCIAIDAANRKWFGTNGNGVYLISADNNTQLQHFQSSNSGLLSDYIESIAINEQTGEVFFGTNKGLCSYMSDATETNDEMTTDNVWAYPNPVKPDYTGLITITGLTYNADVKICTSNGVVVNEGRSSGGSYTWDGCDQNGDRLASGVYMVQTATSDGSKGTVCKIAIIR